MRELQPDAIMRDVDNARVWAGLHWRRSMRHGAAIGRAVARQARPFFQPMHCRGLSTWGGCH